MRRFLLACCTCLVATTLLAQQSTENMAETTSPIASLGMPCPYQAAELMLVDDDPECLLCHPSGIPVGSGGAMSGLDLNAAPQDLMDQTLAAR